MKYELEVISPLHIGSGRIISPIEYTLEDKFYRTNMDKLFDDKRFATNKFIEGVKGGTLYLGKFAPELAKEHTRYGLDIAKSTKEGLLQGLTGGRSSDIREFIKTKDDVYIPGSSIKGAIRTAILWWVLKNDSNQFNRARTYLRDLIRPEKRVDKKWVDNEIEKEVFGKEPTCDLLKALKVSDTNSVDVERLRIEEVRTLTTLRQGGHNWKKFYTFIEALKPKTKLDLKIGIDKFFLEGDAAKELQFENKQNLLKKIPELCNEFAGELIKYENAFFERYNTSRELDGILEFYKNLNLQKLKEEKSFLLHLSWGSGWHGMTVGRLLEPDLLRDLRRRFGLGKDGVSEFPKTRRLVFEDGKPRYPLGWVKVKVGE